MLQSLWIKICKRRRQGFRRENKQFGFTVGDDEEANSNDPLATVNRSQTIRIFKQNSRPTGDLSPSGWSIITNLVVKDYFAASAPAILPYTVAITSPEIPPPPSPA